MSDLVIPRDAGNGVAPDTVVTGLRGVLACTTSVSSIADGTLRYRGYDVRDLVGQASFADVTLLLWHGEWPDNDQRERLAAALTERRSLPDVVQRLITACPVTADPLALMQAAIAIDGTCDPRPDNRAVSAVLDKAMTLQAHTANLVGVIANRVSGNVPPQMPADISREAAMLWLATGDEPDPLSLTALDAVLVTFAEHELNPSTFAARVVAGTRSDYWSAITAAVGALKGPRHAGAFAAGATLVRELGTPAAARAFVAGLSGDPAVSGFGVHKIYGELDPRVAGIRRFAELLAADGPHERLWQTAVELETRLRATHGLNPTAELYAGLVIHLLGIPLRCASALVATARGAGWTAHVLEQYSDDVVLRPRALYIGPPPRSLP